MIKKLLALTLLVPLALTITSCDADQCECIVDSGEGSILNPVVRTAKNVTGEFLRLNAVDNRVYDWNGIEFTITMTDGQPGNAAITGIVDDAATFINLDFPTTINGIPIVSIGIQHGLAVFAEREIETVNFNRMHYLETIWGSQFRSNEISYINFTGLEDLAIMSHAFQNNPIRTIVLNNLPGLFLQGVANLPSTPFSTPTNDLSYARVVHIVNPVEWATDLQWGTACWWFNRNNILPNAFVNVIV